MRQISCHLNVGCNHAPYTLALGPCRGQEVMGGTWPKVPPKHTNYLDRTRPAEGNCREKWEEKCLQWKHAHIIADETLGSGEQGAEQAEVKDRAGKAVGLGGGVAEGWARGIVRPGERTNGQHGNSSNRRRSEAAVAWHSWRPQRSARPIRAR